eukprot:gene40763-49711_t
MSEVVLFSYRAGDYVSIPSESAQCGEPNLVLSPTGRYAAIVMQSYLRIMDYHTKQETWTSQLPRYLVQQHEGSLLTFLQVDSDKTVVAVVDAKASQIAMYDMNCELVHQGAILSGLDRHGPIVYFYQPSSAPETESSTEAKASSSSRTATTRVAFCLIFQDGSVLHAEWLPGRQSTINCLPLCHIAGEQPGKPVAVLRATFLPESQQLLLAYRQCDGDAVVALHDPAGHFQCAAVLASVPVLREAPELPEPSAASAGWMGRLLGTVQPRREACISLLALACSPDERLVALLWGDEMSTLQLLYSDGSACR